MQFVCHSYVNRTYSYVIYMSLAFTRMSSVCHSYVLVCSSYVIRMSIVCIRMSSVRHSSVIVCHPYVTHMYSYVIRMLLVCTRMPSYVIRMYSYVISMSLVCGVTMNLSKTLKKVNFFLFWAVCHPYVIVCTRISFVYRSYILVRHPYVYVLVCHPYVTRLWLYHEPISRTKRISGL